MCVCHIYKLLYTNCIKFCFVKYSYARFQFVCFFIIPMDKKDMKFLSSYKLIELFINNVF